MVYEVRFEIVLSTRDTIHRALVDEIDGLAKLTPDHFDKRKAEI
jgi:hypothetical protein